MAEEGSQAACGETPPRPPPGDPPSGRGTLAPCKACTILHSLRPFLHGSEPSESLTGREGRLQAGLAAWSVGQDLALEGSAPRVLTAPEGRTRGPRHGAVMFRSVVAVVPVLVNASTAIAVACLALPCSAMTAAESGPAIVTASLERAPADSITRTSATSGASTMPGERLTSVTEERVLAFRRAMAELSGVDLGASTLHFRADYATGAPRLVPETRTSRFPEDDTIIMSPGMVGRDLWAEEMFLLEGREDDFYDASRKWMSRKIKGSDAASLRRGGRISPKFAWDDGPLAGFRRGPISVMAGEDQWSLRWSRKMARPGWVARIGCGVEDGEERIAFSIGRSLFHARTAR